MHRSIKFFFNLSLLVKPDHGPQGPIDYDRRVWGQGVSKLSPLLLRYWLIKFGLANLPKKEQQVLDVGCGGGVVAKIIKRERPVWQLTGCDISKTSLNLARQDARGVRFVWGDIYQLPFPSASFDVVLLIDVLEHLADPEQALNEIGRVLRPGGFFYAVVPIEGSRWTLHGWVNKSLGYNLKHSIGHIQQFTWPRLEQLLKESRIRVLKHRYTYHYLYQLANVLYFLFLTLLNKKVSFSLENRAEGARSRWIRWGWRVLSRSFALLVNIESWLFSFWPGQTVLVVGRKGDRLEVEYG